jgi:hypothetical protein
MTEDRFESRLRAMFDTPPPFADNPAFASAVEGRLTRAARWRADLIAAAWIVAGAAVLWGVLTGLDTPALALASSQAAAAFGALLTAGGIWLLPALAVGGVLLFQAFEDAWARD